MIDLGEGVVAECGTLRMFVTQQFDHVLVRIYDNVKQSGRNGEVYRSSLPVTLPEGIRMATSQAKVLGFVVSVNDWKHHAGIHFD